MNISSFSYINTDYDEQKNLIENIENFYINNNFAKTLNHVRLVAKTNVSIAEKFKLNPDVCALSGMLHDISTVMKPDDMVIYATHCGILLDDAEKKYPFLLHQQISKLFIQELFNINNSDVLSAVECHTTLKSNPSQHDMALFISDKLSWDQDGEPLFYKKVSLALSLSLENACYEYITYILDNNMILHPHKWLLEAKSYLQKHLTK